MYSLKVCSLRWTTGGGLQVYGRQLLASRYVAYGGIICISVVYSCLISLTEMLSILWKRTVLFDQSPKIVSSH